MSMSNNAYWLGFWGIISLFLVSAICGTCAIKSHEKVSMANLGYEERVVDVDDCTYRVWQATDSVE